MKYIVCEKPGNFALLEKAEPGLKAGEVMVKIKKVGICGTDLHAYAGNQAFFTYPRILGHELAAEVLETGSDDHGMAVGDKVVVMPYLSCGKCVACRQGKTNCCAHLKVLGVHTDGGMQEIVSLPAEILIPAPELTMEEMAIVEPLSIGDHAIRRAQLMPGETIVVIGCGPIGLGIMKLAQLAGARVIAIDVNDSRLEYAKTKIGVDLTVNALGDAAAEVKELTNGDLATAVFDATGHKGALESGINYMAHGGRYILVGLSKADLSFNHPTIHAKETTIMCSRNATMEDFKHVISVLEKGGFPTGSFVTHRVAFTEMIDRFDSWTNPDSGVIKAMVDF